MESDKNANHSGGTSHSNEDLEEAKEERLEQMIEGNPEEDAGHAENGSGSCPDDRQGTRDLFEKFYGKPYDEITEADIGPGEDIDWGSDLGGEKF